MKVYFENQCGEVVGTITDYQFSLEAAGGYWRVPSFVVAMPDGTFKVVDIEKCRHKLDEGNDFEQSMENLNPETAGNIVYVSKEYLKMIYNKYNAHSEQERREAVQQDLKHIAEMIKELPFVLKDGDLHIGPKKRNVTNLKNGEAYISFEEGIGVKRIGGNPNYADVYHRGELLGSVKIK